MTNEQDAVAAAPAPDAGTRIAAAAEGSAIEGGRGTATTRDDAWRDAAWARLSEPWDIVVVGGGVTGAGILRLAGHLGLRAILLEQHDIAWGTSSRSSKLVHGGLRYLKQFELKLVYESVRERERLMREAPGLVDELGFIFPNYRGDATGPLAYRLALTTYDVLAGRRTHRHYDTDRLLMLAPQLDREGLRGGYRYADAETDDARLTLRLVLESLGERTEMLTYARAEGLLRGADGKVAGVVVRDLVGRRTAELRAPIVINATGAWADRLRGDVGAEPRIRPLRGSHLIFPHARVPVAQAISFAHPADQRPLFLFPWEGSTIFGTTDVDHRDPLDEEPRMSADEAGYLMEALAARVPSLELRLDDAISSFAGVRPVVGSGKADPSKESRDHVVWDEHGLVTVTGGKLTTFGIIARDTFKDLRHRLPDGAKLGPRAPMFDPPRSVSVPAGTSLEPAVLERLVGRYGAATGDLLAAAGPGELERLPGTDTVWAELRWAARSERIVHLEDLMLRRTRLGLLATEGGLPLLERVRGIVAAELGWDDTRWSAEADAYRALWQSDYAPAT